MRTNKVPHNLISTNVRDVTACAMGEATVAPRFLDTLTLFQPSGQIMPDISEVAPKNSPQLHL